MSHLTQPWNGLRGSIYTEARRSVSEFQLYQILLNFCISGSLSMKQNNTIYFTGILGRLNQGLHKKHLEKYMVHRELQIKFAQKHVEEYMVHSELQIIFAIGIMFTVFYILTTVLGRWHSNGSGLQLTLLKMAANGEGERIICSLLFSLYDSVGNSQVCTTM